MTREYIELKSPTPDTIRNAATKNPSGTWVKYGSVSESHISSSLMLDVPSQEVLKAVRDQADMGRIAYHRAKGENGMSIYVFKVLEH